jgi:hypothetical protein
VAAKKIGVQLSVLHASTDAEIVAAFVTMRQQWRTRDCA